MATNDNENKKTTVEVPAEEFAAMAKTMKDMAGEIASLKIANDPQKVMRKPSERTASILFLNDKPVIGYVNKGTENKPLYIYEGPNPKKPSEYINFVDIILLGEERPIKVVYNEFTEQAEKKQLTIKSTRKEEWITEEGETVKKEVPEGMYYTNETGAIVPLEVRGSIFFYTVELPDGTTQEFHERYVNIAR